MMHFDKLGGEMRMKKSRQRYSPEAAQLVADQGYSVRQAAEVMNVGKSTMDKWVRQLRKERGGEDFQGTPMTPDQLRIRELERQVKRIEMEKEILKKATALLMSDSMNNLR